MSARSGALPAPTAAESVPALSRVPLLGMAVFIASESMFFLAVIFAFINLRPADLAVAKAELDVPRTAVFSLFLWASSGTVALAYRGRRGHRGWLALTWVFGLIFIVGQGSEYARMLTAGVAPSTGAFETTFFTLTGLHGMHVVIGLTAIAGLFLASTIRGRGVQGTAWEAVSWYWHFVDAVWVVVFSVVYVWTALS